MSHGIRRFGTFSALVVVATVSGVVHAEDSLVDLDVDRSWLQSGEVNVGYNVFAAHRGSGYASRAVELLIRHLAESTAFDAATLVIHPDNAASLAVAAKCGFVPNGEIESSRYFKRLIKSA